MPDERGRAAIATWAPRFVAQGVDYNDFVRTTSGIERWDQWLEAWVATAEMHAELARAAGGQGRTRPPPPPRSPPPPARRGGAPLAAPPWAPPRPRPPPPPPPPLALLLPGLDSTKEEFFYWENVFLARGLATLSLDGPGQGETGYTTHIRPDYEVAVTIVLDALSQRRDLALDRVGAVGVSLGGYYAPRPPPCEPRIRAAVAIGGPYNFGECWDGLPALTREAFTH